MFRLGGEHRSLSTLVGWCIRHSPFGVGGKSGLLIWRNFMEKLELKSWGIALTLCTWFEQVTKEFTLDDGTNLKVCFWSLICILVFRHLLLVWRTYIVWCSLWWFLEPTKGQLRFLMKFVTLQVSRCMILLLQVLLTSCHVDWDLDTNIELLLENLHWFGN